MNPPLDGRSGPHRGWSFVELMIVVALVAILLAIAVPSYRAYLQRGHRAEAVRALLQVAACQERVRARTGFYDTTRCAPADGGDHYAISLEPAERSGVMRYVATARPARSDPSDACGALSIDQSGTRGIEGDPRHFRDCWGGR